MVPERAVEEANYLIDAFKADIHMYIDDLIDAFKADIEMHIDDLIDASFLTASAAFAKVAESTEFKPKNVKAVVTAYSTWSWLRTSSRRTASSRLVAA